MLNYTAFNNSLHFSGTSGIYCILNVQNGKKYVGRAQDVGSRLKGHLNSLKLGKHHSKLLQADFHVYGEQEFKFCLLEKLDFKTYREKLFWADFLEFIWTEALQAEYGGARKSYVTRKFKQRLQESCRQREQIKKQIDVLRLRLQSYERDLNQLNIEIEGIHRWLEEREKIMQP